MNRQNTLIVGNTRCLEGLLTFLLAIVFLTYIASPAFAMISVGTLTKEKAKEKYGITMHAQQNGDAGIKVWLQFKKEGWLEKFTYAELRMRDAKGNHLLSARLEPRPVNHGQPEEITTVSFSAQPGELEKCSFLVVCYNSIEGDVGYYLNMRDFLDLKSPVTEK